MEFEKKIDEQITKIKEKISQLERQQAYLEGIIEEKRFQEFIKVKRELNETLKKS